MNGKMILATLLGAILLTSGCASAPKKDQAQPMTAESTDAAEKADEFAPVPEDHPYASVWNDPDFVRRLTYTFTPSLQVEPKLDVEEAMVYREEIVPLLRDDENQDKAIRQLESMAKSAATAESKALFEFTLGNVYFRNGDLTNAVRYFDQATANFPDFLRAWQNMGFAHFRNGEQVEAIEPLARSLSLGASDSKIYGVLGFCYLNEEQWISAEAALRQAVILEPDNNEYKLGLVRCLIQQEHYSAASATLDELLARNPDEEKYLEIQANLYLQTEQPDLAAVNLELLRRMGKASAKNLSLLGDVYMTQEALGMALPVYLEAVELEGSDNLQSALRAADIMVSRGAWEESNALFAKIRAVGGDEMPEEDEMKLLKLESKVAIANGQGEEAIRVLEEIIELDPMDGEALLLAGDYYSQSGDKERALFRYELASKIGGYEADGLVKQAQLLAQSSKYVEAMDLLKRAQQIRPRDNVQRYLEAIERVARTSRG